MINGIINVYKEKDFTSFDVVAVMKGIAGQRKIGHTGTLDPQAQGVLPVCLGNATKLCDMLTDKRKEYIGEFRLGIKTDTLDATGEVLATREVKVTEDELRAAILSFIGGYNQIPPMYSAKKVNGQRLYDIARKGIEIERKPVFVDIYDIQILNINLPDFTIRVSCGKGTYIRSLGEDIGAACNELCIMTKLTRTAVSNFTIDRAYKLSELTQLKNEGRLSEVVMPTDMAFMDYRAITVLPMYRKLIDNGNKLWFNDVYEQESYEDGEILRVYNDEKHFVGLYSVQAKDKNFVPFKMFIGE